MSTWIIVTVAALILIGVLCFMLLALLFVEFEHQIRTLPDKKRRRLLWITGVSSLTIDSLIGILLFRSVSESKARELATGQFHRFVDDFGIDPRVFDGPAPGNAGNVHFDFQWTYSDEQGKIVIYVSVEESGWTDTAHEGDLERLRSGKQAR